jgi:arylsulfatase A-like enzyme
MIRRLAGCAALVFASCQAAPPPSFFFARQADEAEAEFDPVQFRSFRKDGRLTAQVSMDDVLSRFSLVPPIPSRLTYEVSIPEEPRFDLAFGVSSFDEEVLPAPIEFRILIDSGDGEEVVFRDAVRRRFANRWFEPAVDLGRWAGESVRLVFETRYQETEFTRPEGSLGASGQGFLPAWANPVLRGRPPVEPKPDLILISIDCLRADHVGAYGYDRGTTPTLDALAEDGVVFEDAVSVSSWTLPTHMSMLTGVLPTRHGLRQTQKKFPSIPYLPVLLAESSYESVGIVSSLLLTPTFGFDEGFDRYYALVDVPAAGLVDAAIREMTASVSASRFLFLHLFDAHWPYFPPEDLIGRFGERPEDMSELLRKVIDRRPPSGPEDIDGLKSLYDAEVFQIDRELGRLMEALKAAGRYDSSLIVVTADHGEGFYEHGFWQHSEVIYNEVSHIPLIVKWPGNSPRGRESRIASQLDIFPIILEAASLPTPHERKGLTSAEGASVLTEITWEGNERRGAAMKVAVRRGPLKYVATFEGDVSDPEFVSRLVKEELYDLSEDRGEKNDIIAQRGSSDAEGLRSEVRAFLKDVRGLRAGDGAGAIVLDEEMRDRLRALGYLEP